jgi:hypothetical protein
MAVAIWKPAVETTEAEKRILARCKKSKLFVFLREHRHELFDDAFQLELVATYSERKGGKEPVAPAMLAMVTLLQAALHVSDEDAVEFAEMDRRWQMVLDTLSDEGPPFSQGSLVNFRMRVIAHDLDRRLLERTVELARKTRGFGAAALRAAFDSSPLFGAGRVEDTFNLIGHAVRDVLDTVAMREGKTREEVAVQAGVHLFTGASIKASLDIDWEDRTQKAGALERLVTQVRALGAFLEREQTQAMKEPPLVEQWKTVQQLIAQDTEPDPSGGGVRIKEGVAKERRISITDRQMRHGRKSKSSRVDGYKRHLAVDLDNKLTLAAAVLPANRPDIEAAGVLFSDVERQGLTVEVLHHDLGYLAAPDILRRHTEGMAIHCKPFPLRNADRFTKADFKLDFAKSEITCPAGARAPLQLGSVTRFPSDKCKQCALRARCTTSKGGRSLSVHAQEQLLVRLRAEQRTKDGRAELRRRTGVEHKLAALSRTQGRRARYRGVRKNLFDVRRHAAVDNLYVAARAA